MKGNGKMETEKIKVVRSYWTADMAEETLEKEGDFTPAETVEQATALAGENLLKILNEGLREDFRSGLGKLLETEIPPTAMKDEAVKWMLKPLVETQRAQGKKLKEARQAAEEQIKSSDQMKAIIRQMGETVFAK